MKTLVVAEPGSTHEGDLATMLRLVDLAAQVGCDVFKNQWTSDPEAICARRRAPEYLWSYRKLAYPIEWHADIREACHRRGLEYGCSTYIPADVARVAPFCDWLKGASFEAGESAMRAAFAPYRDRLILSTGMMTAREVVDVRHCARYVLHCVSSYVTPADQANLGAILMMRELLIGTNALPGWSDHTQSTLTGALAVAAGARAVEFHLRLDDCDPQNADHEVSRDPERAAAYVASIREAERILGDGEKRVMPSELAFLRYRTTTA